MMAKPTSSKTLKTLTIKMKKDIDKAAPALASRPVNKRDQVPPAGQKSAKIMMILSALGQPEGTTIAELMNVTDWQAHSLRGMISTLRTKKKISIVKIKRGDGQTAYKITEDIQPAEQV